MLWSGCVPSKFICWNFMVNVMVLRGRTVRKWSIAEPKGWDMHTDQRTWRSQFCPFLSFCHEGTGTKHHFEAWTHPYQTPNLLVPWPWTFQPPHNYKKLNSIVYKLPSLGYFVIIAQKDWENWCLIELSIASFFPAEHSFCVNNQTSTGSFRLASTDMKPEGFPCYSGWILFSFSTHMD